MPEIKEPKLNLDKFGMPKDYATYVWLLYKKVVEDDSPQRRAFLEKKQEGYFGFDQQYIYK
jgi:hypothetical protein